MGICCAMKDANCGGALIFAIPLNHARASLMSWDCRSWDCDFREGTIEGRNDLGRGAGQPVHTCPGIKYKIENTDISNRDKLNKFFTTILNASETVGS